MLLGCSCAQIQIFAEIKLKNMEGRLKSDMRLWGLLLNGAIEYAVSKFIWKLVSEKDVL